MGHMTKFKGAKLDFPKLSIVSALVLFKLV